MTTDTDVKVQAGEVELAATVVVPPDARAVVLFAHGSGSSRHSPRNRRVAESLNQAGYATVLLDLLTADEDAEDHVSCRYRFDVGMLGRRLAGAIDWIDGQRDLSVLSLGLFGASTGAAAALLAATARQHRVGAIVSRGGRPDLAGAALDAVRTPTLLIVGGADRDVLTLNQEVAVAMGDLAQVVVVPGATHLFEEPGAMDQVIERACAWFSAQLERRGGQVLDEVPPEAPS